MDIAKNFFRKFVFAVTITISIQIFRINIEQKGIGIKWLSRKSNFLFVVIIILPHPSHRSKIQHLFVFIRR